MERWHPRIYLDGLQKEGCESLTQNGVAFTIESLLEVNNGEKRKGWPNAKHFITHGHGTLSLTMHSLRSSSQFLQTATDRLSSVCL